MSTGISAVAASIEHRSITRCRTFAVSGRSITLDVISRVLALLHDEHATGQVRLNLSQGAPTSIQFEESAKIT